MIENNAQYRVTLRELKKFEEALAALPAGPWRAVQAAAMESQICEMAEDLEAYEKLQWPIAEPTPEQLARFRACQEDRCGPECEFCK